MQAEFTRKCQKLSEFESKKQTESVEQVLKENDFLTDEVKNEILKTYLEELQKNNVPKVISSYVGSGIALNIPPKPTNMEEAKEIVSKMFN